MPLIINREMLKGELNEHLRTNKRALSDVRLTKKVLAEACPLIEQRLKDPKYLRQWNWAGKQAFYNDEPNGQKEVRGLFTKQDASQHLVGNFRVIPRVAAGGYGGFEITNDKVVTSSRGKYNLFELLWHGFGPYSATFEKRYRRLSQTEIWQMSWSQRRSWRRGVTLYHGAMTFYYRYGGTWFYRLKSRKGMNPSLNDKFKQYVMGAVEYGIENAIKNIMESGGGSSDMKKILEGIK